MINLFALKQKAQAEAAAGIDRKQKKQPAQLRVEKDISELDIPKTISMSFPDLEDQMLFHLAIAPDEGFYEGGAYQFSVQVKDAYPHEPPKVLCQQKVYHPNIDYQGNVCLNILREDWKPVLSLNAVLIGMLYLFLEPNADDPLNKEAAKTLRANESLFAQNVTKAMRGGTIDDCRYDDVRIRKNGKA